MNDRQRLLRNALRGNAAFSTLSGLVFALAGGAVADAIGVADARIVTATGVQLLGFAALLAFVASRETIHRPTALAIVAADLAWVVGTVPVVALGLLSRTGAIAAVAVADVVLIFAVLQYLGVRRARGTRSAVATAGAR